MKQAVIGVDVGTGSARAGVFDFQGALLGAAARDIRLHHGPDGIVEQESADIWNAVCAAIRAAMTEAGPVRAMGIGVDAACSMVVEGQQLSNGGHPDRDVIVWMDHRATTEAAEINEGGHAVLAYLGGRISPEMQTPKLKWLARHRPDAFTAAPRFMDLADWLTFKLSGSEARSACTVTCKWTYLAHEGRWDPGYFDAIGLGALKSEGFRRIGTDIRAPGTAIGTLCPAVAAATGLPQGTPVAAGLIDAHAGGIGTLGAPDAPGTIATRMAYVFGTSACTMSSHPEPLTIPGVWGPYWGAMFPGLWLNEGGQSAAGAALDRLVRMHPAYPALAGKTAGLVLDELTNRALSGCEPSETLRRAVHLTVVPDFNGNRAPLADPDARAVVAGLGMDAGENSLVDLFIAGLVGIGCGLRHILDVQQNAGLATELIFLSGGAGNNSLARQVLADATGRPVAVPDTPEPVLLGAAMLGAVAGGCRSDLPAAMQAMSSTRTLHTPVEGELRDLHDKVYRRFRALQAASLAD